MRVLWLILLIVEIGAAVGWLLAVVSWAVKQNRYLDLTISTPPHVIGVGLPIVAALAVVAHMVIDATSPVRTLWWVPFGWLALAALMVYVRRVQNRPRRTW